MLALGIDYSTKRCGFTVMDSFFRIRFCQSLEFFGCNTKKEIRKSITDKVTAILEATFDGASVDFIILERVRLRVQGFISFNSIYQLTGVVSSISNVSIVPVVNIDVRSWKARILGSAKSTKEDSVAYVKTKYNINKNHDACDSVCIAEAGIKFYGKDNKLIQIVD
jgi:Holliday junction resolvasome RuvABC endonuclease subunit